jgi:hypothetical protein
MKKLILVLTTVVLVLGLTACETGIVDIPIEIEEPVIPVEREPEPSPSVDTSPEVIVEFVDRFIEVPAQIERVRRYQPGTYMLAESRPNNQNGYVFTVVTIDDYGRIAGVYIDQTITTRNLFRSEEGLFYVLVPGNRSNIPDAYRLITLSTPVEAYPTKDDAIRSSDLVVGIDTNAIRALTRVTVNETKQMATSRLNANGALNYQQQMRLVAQKIIDDNTTYGFNLVEQNGVLTTSSIEGITEALDVPLFLVQSILDGPARLSEGTSVRSTSTPRYGSYIPGVYAEFSPSAFLNNELIHGMSIVVVDAFGRITGVYLDELVASTARTNVVASKQILKDAAGGTNQTEPWFVQANRLANQMVLNQGINGFSLVRLNTFAPEELRADAPTLVVSNFSPVLIRVNELFLATQANLQQATFKDYVDGTYLVAPSASSNAFAYITIRNQNIVDVFVDRFVLLDQGSMFRRGQAVSIQRFNRRFQTPTGVITGDVLVYNVDDVFYSANAVTEVNNVLLPSNVTLTKDQQVNLTQEEIASLRPVPGWQTASSLRQVDSTQQRWFEDQRSIATAIQEIGNLNDFHIIEGRITNATGVTDIVSEFALELVAQGLYQARDNNNIVFDVPFLPQRLPIADGSYIAHAAPEANGAMSFSYMVVEDGQIITWIVDQTSLQNNRLRSVLFGTSSRREEWITLSSQLRASQHQLLPQLIEKPAPNPTINTVRISPIFTQPGIPVINESTISAIDAGIRQTVEAKQQQDLRLIRSHFLSSEAFFKDRTLVAFQTISTWLPGSIRDPELNYEYRLVWRTSNRDITITQELGQYSVRIARLDEDSVGQLELEIYLPNSNIPLSRQMYELPLARRSTFGQEVLNSSAFDLPSLFVLANQSVQLPTSDVVSIRWQSGQPNVFSTTGQVANVNQPTTIELTAFVDLDGNNELNANEPLRQYNIVVLPLAQAITRLESELDTAQVGEFIGSRLTLGTRSSVWGLSYAWSSSSQQVQLFTQSGISEVFVGSLDFPADVPLTATLNVGNNSVTKTFRVDAGNKDRYETFATLDLPILTTSRQMVVGDSLFESFSSTGRFYRSQITFYSTDFGQFVNAQGQIIGQHPTIDVCFEVVVTARYSGGTQEASVTKQDEFCILSAQTLLKQMNEDKDQLVDYVLSLGLSSHVDQPLTLPLNGLIHGHPIRWEVVENQEALLEGFHTSGLSSGLVLVKTSSGSLSSGDVLRLRGIVDVSVGTPPVLVAKEIRIEVRN